ncbi:hypothetical protein [Demequina sp.]|uniref:hypothetical protein n=1 Tax=Demequina sp. TaxID=2050685 RepID=UPI003A8A01C6
MKRITAAASALAAGSLTLAGCSTSTPADTDLDAAIAEAADVTTCVPGEHTLSVVGGSQATDAMAVATAALQEKYPELTIEAEPAATSGYAELTQQVVADIAVGKRPDVIMSGLGQLGFWVEEYDAAPIDPSALADTYQDQFLAAGTVDGEVYLAPAQISAPVLLVNQDALDAAGAGQAEDIVDYASWIAAAQKVTEATGAPSVSIASVGLADWYSQAFVQASGGTFVAQDGTAGFDDATGIEALNIWPTMAEQGLELGVLNVQEAIAPFASGEAAFVVATTSMIATLQGMVGEAFALTAVDLPGANGTEGDLPAGGNGWIVLSDDSCEAAYASEYIGLLLGTEAVLKASGTEYSYIPVDSAAAEQLLATEGLSQAVTYAWTYDKALTPWGGFDGTMTAQVNDAINTMAQELQLGAAAEDAVPAAAAAIDAIVGGN